MAKIPLTSFTQCKEGMELQSIYSEKNIIKILSIKPESETAIRASWVRRGFPMGDYMNSGTNSRLLFKEWFIVQDTRKEFTDEEYEELLV